MTINEDEQREQRDAVVEGAEWNLVHSSSPKSYSRQFPIEKQKAISRIRLRLAPFIGTGGIDSSAWPRIRLGKLKFFGADSSFSARVELASPGA